MIKNYFKIAYRNLLKNKLFSLINLSGLSLGLACSLLIFQYVNVELSYDRFHKNADDIYRVYLDIYKHGNRDAQSARVAPAVASAFQAAFPSIDTYTRLVILGPDGVLTYQDQYSSEAGIYLADAAFFDVFSFPLLQGNPPPGISPVDLAAVG